MKLTKKPNKIKIEFEYLPKSSNFGIISSKELEALVVNIELKDGNKIYHDDIKAINWKLRKAVENETR